jgi:hypothetical protein
MAIQSTYSENISDGFAGQLANETNWDADTKVVETAAGIGYGLAVSRGSADDGVTLGGAAFLGVTVRDMTNLNVNADKIPQYSHVAVMRFGDIFLTASENVTDGAQIYFNTTTGAFGVTGGGKTAVVGAYWQKTTASGAIGIGRFSTTL